MTQKAANPVRIAASPIIYLQVYPTSPFQSFMHTNMAAHHTHAVHHHIHLHGFTLTHRTCPLSAYIPLFLIGIICL